MGSVFGLTALPLALISTIITWTASVDDAHVGGLCRTNIRLFLLGNFLHGISKLFLCIFCGKYVLLKRRYVC